MSELTDREILEACARAKGYAVCDPFRIGKFRVARSNGLSFDWNPLKDDGDCALLENKCGLVVNCRSGVAVYESDISFLENIKENFCPGNDAERRRASCLAVARAQLEKEKCAAAIRARGNTHETS